MNKKTVISATDSTILKLKVLAKKKESVRSKLAVTAEDLSLKAKQLAETAKEKESIRRRLMVTAEELRLKAKQLATTAEEKEDVRRKLEVTAENLDIKAKLLAETAKEKESIRRRLVVTAKELRLKAKLLAETAKEKESVRSKLVVTAENLATTAEEKEDVRRRLVVTAKELRLKAKLLAETAKEKESVRSKLVVTAENLARAKARDEAMLASMGDGLVVVDRDMRTVLINRAAEAATGWKSHEVLGKVWSEVIALATEDGKKLLPQKSPSFLAIQDEKTYTSTTSYLYTRKDKTTFPVAITVSPFKVGSEFIGATIVFRDVTREREIDKAKTEFVSLASHELRTPLTAIDGIVSMISDGEYGPVNEELKQPLADVNISSERLIHLVNDLLNLSRIQGGRMKYTLSEFSIANVITETVHLLKPLSQQKKIQLTATRFDPVVVQADSDKVRQVLNNLIGNALKFTDKGSITVGVKVVDDKVEIFVTDTGIGIAKEDQVKLFGKFQQLESGKGRPTGTGLGLHISREMTRKMGGELWIEKSGKGIGSTFAFSIPKSQSEFARKIKEAIELEVIKKS